MKLTYRPEIDGLRAIAVGAVILYHAQITILGHKPFQGGFIGVDIFFVISGYLITSIILKELVTTGAFSFKHFYERRIRRILPALLFVMLVSLPFAWLYLLPIRIVDFSKSILYSLGFSSNFYFHYTGQEYGAESGLLKPFLHTWSLSVEEQYYILFPIVLLVTFKYLRKYLIHILILGFVISLGLAEWTSRNYPSISFYLLHTRMWELLLGSILAYFEISKGYRSYNQTFNLILPTIGLILIGHSILFFNDKIFHPSFYTLSPIAGVCLIIWFSNKDELITKILSTKIFVGIGLISYSLYLWHYPLFSFFRITESTQGIFNKSLLGFLLLFLSIISYYLIERPTRNKKYSFKIIFLSIITLLLILIITNIAIIKNDGFKKRTSEIFQKNLKQNTWDLLKNSKGQNCYDQNNGCTFNPQLHYHRSSYKKFFIIGDSLMASLMFNLKDRIVNKGYIFKNSTSGECLYFPGFVKIEIKTEKIDGYCKYQIDDFTLNLKKEKNSIIVLGGRLPLFLSNSFFNNQEGGIEGNEWQNKYISLEKYKTIHSSLPYGALSAPLGKYKTIQSSFKNEVIELSKNNKIVLIYPIPEVGWNVPDKLNILLRSIKGNLFSGKKININNYITTSFEVYKNRTKSSFELLDSIQNENIYRVYPHKLFCDTIIKDRCVTHDDKNVFYSDDKHPSIKGAEMINDLIMKEIERIENESN